jgi:D-cysteine desulfhydrase
VAADALASGCDTLVTEGTPQSNHCRATAAVCARLGLQAVLLFRPTAAGQPQGNHLLDVLFGAETRSYTRAEYDANRARIVATVLAELKAAGRRPRWTPTGASEPLGCWGYIRAMAELGEQLSRAGVAECDVAVAISSGTTYAGALLGRQLHGLDRLQLWAVPVSDDAAFHSGQVTALCEETIARFHPPIEFNPGGLRFIDGYVGAGYAIPYRAAIDAIHLLAHTEGIVLDPVYTAKAFCAVLDGIRARRLGFHQPVVFIHTGGIFSDFAWPEILAG